MKEWVRLLELLPPPGLAIGDPQTQAVAPLKDLTNNLALLGGPIQDKQAALACLSALWLRFDHFDKAHSICQDLDTQDGSYWHGIAHRREGDFGNACYWFRRAGTHPVQNALSDGLKDIKEVLEGAQFSPTAFARMVERGGKESTMLEIQELEWRALFQDCMGRALGRAT